MKSSRVFPVAGAAAMVVLLIGCQAAGSTNPSGEPSTLAPSSSIGTQPASVPGPSAVATGSGTARPSVDPSDTSAWLPFVSELYGFSIAYPPEWEAHHASGPWTFPQDTAWPDGVERGDWFFLDGEDGSVAASVWSVVLEPGTSADEWFVDYCRVDVTPCEGDEPKAPASLDGHPGWFVDSSDPQAYFGIGDRIYLLVIWQPADVPALTPYGGGRKLVETFLSTMRLLPEQAG